MSSYTPAQKRAWAKKMAAAKAAKRIVTGHGAYKSKKAGGGGQHYYKKYKAAKAASKTSDGGWLSSGLGAIGDALFPGIGGVAGRGLGSLVKTITGFGNYEVKENSLLVPEAGDPPIVVNSANKSVIIRHREYVDDVVSSSSPNTFKLQNFYINPGDRITLPWLSQIADSFEHYRIKGMIWEFRTMSADALNSTNTALGQVIMATSYNSALPNFQNKYEMENYEFGCSTKPSESLMHPIECARAQSVLGDLYVRSTLGVPNGEDRRLYDFANFQIATNGFQGGSVNAGELWVTYEIELFKPKVVTESGLFIPYALMTGLSASIGTVAQATPLGATVGGLASSLTSASTLNVTSTSTSITFEGLGVADYIVTFAWRGTAAVYAVTSANVSWGISAPFNAVSIVNQSSWPTAYNTQADSYVNQIHFKVTGANTDVTLTPTFNTSPPSGHSLRVEMSQIPAG